MTERGSENKFIGRDFVKLTFVLFFNVRIHVARRYSTEEIDILVRVELCHLALRCRFCALWHEGRQLRKGRVLYTHEDFHLLV